MSPSRDSSAAAVLPAPGDEDPIERAFRLAPVVCDEQITNEEREAMAAGAAGPFVDSATVLAEIRKMAEAEGAGAEFDAIMKRRELEARRPR